MIGDRSPYQSLLSADEVMIKLNISRSTLFRWVREGQFPKPIRVARIRRWRADGIEKWLDEQESAAA